MFIGLIFFSVPIFAQQQYTLSGKVLNSETKAKVADANIFIIGTKIGTSTNNEGYFELKVSAGEHKVRVSCVGFARKEFSIHLPSDHAENLNIQLVPEKLGINELDVLGNYSLADRDTSINSVPLSIFPSVSKITAIEIEKQGAVTLIDAVKYIPGGWTETRGRKTKQFFSVRGQKYPYPDYSINGIWQKEFEETGYFLSALDIESIEVVRSSSALVKGLSGLTGVIDVKTRNPEKEEISLLTKYGEQNNYAANLRYGNKIRKVSFNTSAAFFGTDGPEGRNGRERIANFQGNLNWEINRKFKLIANSIYISGVREFVNIVEPGSSRFMDWEEKFDPFNTLLTHIKLDYRGDDGSLTEFQTNLSYRKARYSRYSISQESTRTNNEDDWEYGINFLHSRPLTPTNTLRFGVLYNHWEAPEGKRYYSGRACNVHTWSGVIANEQKFGKLWLDAGLRLIHGYIVEWGGFGIEGSSSGLQEVEPVMDEYAPLEWQSVLGASYILSGTLSMHYNFAGGTIAPRKGSVNEDAVAPFNETRLQHDLGLRFRSPAQNEISASAFYMDRKNALELSGQTMATEEGLVMELYDNIDKSSYGLELSAKINIPALHSDFFSNATFMNGDKIIDGSAEKDEKLPNVILNSGIFFEYSGLDANVFVHYTGPYANNRFVSPVWIQENGDFPLGDFISANITVGYTFAGKFSTRVFGEVKNIFDQQYYTVAGYPDQGRLIQAGIKIIY